MAAGAEAPLMPATWMGIAVLLLVGLVGSQGAWGFAQFVLSKTGRKAEIARQLATIETDKENTETSRLKILAESQVALQQAVLDADAKTIARLNTEISEWQARCEKHKADLHGLREAASAAMGVFSGLLARMRAAADAGSDVLVLKVSGQEFLTWRDAIAAVWKWL